MNIKDILDKINSINILPENYLMFQIDPKYCYFGKDVDSNVVFMIESSTPKIPAIRQETKSLRFVFNQKCILKLPELTINKIMHVLTCKDKDIEKIKAFILLTKSFSANDTEIDQYNLAKLFSSISALFDKQRQVSEIEIQGLFAELYTILYLRKIGCDIAKYWQSHNKMKFDFSLNVNKRLEVKSTLKKERIHHFRHDQLLSELYDIKIVSILLIKNDQGVSLQKIVDQICDYYSNNFVLMLHIENTISQIDFDYLCNIKYDELYLKDNLRFYDAKDIPQFNEKTPEGVFNAEYDCQLDFVKNLTKNEIIKWIKEEENV